MATTFCLLVSQDAMSGQIGAGHGANFLVTVDDAFDWLP